MVKRWGKSRLQSGRERRQARVRTGRRSTLQTMLQSGQIRGWQGVGLCLCSVVFLGWSAFARTATESSSSTAPKKGAQVSTSSAAKAKHPASAQATGKRASSKKSTQASSRTPSTAAKGKSGRGKKGSKQAGRKRGQQAIDSERARQIQAALIRQRYMEGEPSGKWDSATQAAMQRYQADQGWQSKTTPDSRALIKLGLGPSHDHLLNPENAMTAGPGDSKAANPTPSENNVPHQ